MKSIKLNHQAATRVAAGKESTTWRINDDKDLHVNDQIQLVDKVDPNDPATWQPIGTAVITSILEKQLGQVSKADLQPGEELPTLEDLLQRFRAYYGQQVSAETPVKILRFNFNLGLAKNEKRSNAAVRLFADGGSRGNPGPSAAGYVVVDQAGSVIAQRGVFLGVTTNNQAEYQALKLGLEEALRRGASHVEVYMDSMLVVNQMKGVYKVKNPDLRAINQSITKLVGKFKVVHFAHVPREHNKQADAIVNQVLDAS